MKLLEALVHGEERLRRIADRHARLAEEALADLEELQRARAVLERRGARRPLGGRETTPAEAAKAPADEEPAMALSAAESCDDGNDGDASENSPSEKPLSDGQLSLAAAVHGGDSSIRVQDVDCDDDDACNGEDCDDDNDACTADVCEPERSPESEPVRDVEPSPASADGVWERPPESEPVREVAPEPATAGEHPADNDCDDDDACTEEVCNGKEPRDPAELLRSTRGGRAPTTQLAVLRALQCLGTGTVRQIAAQASRSLESTTRTLTRLKTKDLAVQVDGSGGQWRLAEGAPRARRQGQRQTVALSPKGGLSAEEMRQGAELVDIDTQRGRPRTRADCVNVPRPCPFVACRHHLAVDVDAHTGALYVRGDPSTMTDTCALDVADRGGATLDEVAESLGVSRERVRQIEFAAEEKLRQKADHLVVEEPGRLTSMAERPYFDGRVIDLLKRAPASLGQMAQRTGIARHDLLESLGRLERAGEVRFDGPHGQWLLVRQGGL